MLNKYKADCHYCKKEVQPQKGRIWKWGGRWYCVHNPDEESGHPGCGSQRGESHLLQQQPPSAPQPVQAPKPTPKPMEAPKVEKKEKPVRSTPKTRNVLEEWDSLF